MSARAEGASKSGPARAGGTVVAAVGSVWREDDGVGPAVVRRVAASPGPARGADVALAALEGPIELLGLWDGADLAVVVDASRSGAEPGTVRVVDVWGPDGPVLQRNEEATGRRSSTHGLSVAGVALIARALGRAPARVVVVAVEGERFGHGRALSRPVSQAVDRAARAVLEVVKEQRLRGGGPAPAASARAVRQGIAEGDPEV